MTHYGRIVVAALAMLGALQCLGLPAFAQNQGIGELAQAIRGRPDQDMTRPRYRVEVLAFAYNGFNPDEEVFLHEPFEIRLDTRPPTLLNVPVPAPRHSGLLATLALPVTDQTAFTGESGGSLIAAAMPKPFGTVPAAADGPNRLLEGGTAGEPMPRSAEPLGPADDSTLRSLFEASMASGEAVSRREDRYRIRSAHLQRLIASIKFLDDPSKVPVVFNPPPESPDPGSPPHPGSDGLESNPPEGRTTGPGEIDEGGFEPAARGTRSTFRLLRLDELMLRDALQRLQKNGDYTPLAHGGWVQATYPPGQATAVDLGLLGTVNPVGTVKLHLGRFLHVTVELVYRAPPASPPPPATPVAGGVLRELTLPARYALRAQRRIRSGEVHYIDHPAIGLLVVVTPAPLETHDGDDPSSPSRGPAA